MAVHEVLLYPDPRLKQVAQPAQASEVDAIAGDLIDTMRSYERCVGIAAPQIGISSRVAVVDVIGHPKAETSSGLIVLANPHVVKASGAEVAREGCLSLPEVTANVRRPTTVVVEHLSGSLRCEGSRRAACSTSWTTSTGSSSWTASSRWSTTCSAVAAMRRRRGTTPSARS